MVENQNKNDITEQDLWSLYLYALKSPVTREKYQKTLKLSEVIAIITNKPKNIFNYY